jgi:hypothetical protein
VEGWILHRLWGYAEAVELRVDFGRRKKGAQGGRDGQRKCA